MRLRLRRPWADVFLHPFFTELFAVSRSFATLSTGVAIASLLQVAALSVLASYLTHDVFGQIAMLMATARLVSGFFTPNIGPVILGIAAEHWYAGRPNAFATLFWPLWRIEVLSAVVASLALGLLIRLLAPGWLPAIEPWAAILAACGPIGAASTGFAAWLRMHGDFWSIGLRDVVVATQRLLLVLLIPALAVSPSTVTAFWFCADLLGLTVLGWRFLVLSSSLGLPGPRSAGPIARRHIALAYRCHAWSSMRLATLELDTLLIGLLVSDIAAGVVRLAKQWALLINRIGEVTEQVIFPRLAEARGRAGPRAVETLDRFISRAALASTILALLAWFAIDHIVISLVLPNAPSDLLSAIRIQVVAFSLYLIGVTHVPRIILARQERLYTYLLSAATTVFFAALLCLAGLIGALAAPTSHLIFNLLWYGGTLALLSRTPPTMVDGRGSQWQ